MVAFVILILIFFLCSWNNSVPQSFNKDKSTVLKAVFPLLIVAHHLSFSVDSMLVFRSWGSPIVSLFFFCSGYGLMKSFKVKGDIYLSSFIINRVIRSLILPFVLAKILMYVINGSLVLPYSWFVPTMLYCYLLFYIFAKYGRRYLLIYILIFCLLYVVTLMYMGFAKYWYISILAFPFGLFYASKENVFRGLWSNPVLYYATIPLCLLSICALYLCENEIAYMLCYVLLPLIMVNICCKNRVERISCRFVLFCAGISYEIYLVQGVVMTFLRSKHITSDALYVLWTYLLVLFVAYGLKKIEVVLKWMFGEKKVLE